LFIEVDLEEARIAYPAGGEGQRQQEECAHSAMMSRNRPQGTRNACALVHSLSCAISSTSCFGTNTSGSSPFDAPSCSTLHDSTCVFFAFLLFAVSALPSQPSPGGGLNFRSAE